MIACSDTDCTQFEGPSAACLGESGGFEMHGDRLSETIRADGLLQINVSYAVQE